MSRVTYNDIYETEVKIGFSCSGYIRIDMKGETIPTKMHLGEVTYPCISMTVPQAQILKSALEELIQKSWDGES